MIRGEVYILFLNALLIYRFLLLSKKSFQYSKNDILIFGFIVGLLALSRQWAFLLFPSYFLLFFFLEKNIKKNYIKFLFFTFFIGFLFSGWFYINLLFDYGSLTAFNQTRTNFSFSNQELSFYSLDNDVLSIPFYESKVPAGFPSPAADFMDLDLNLQEQTTEQVLQPCILQM